MLGAPDIIHALSSDCEEVERISIIPRPNLDELEHRGGTSVDLRLGRWFRGFKQTKSNSISLNSEELGDSTSTGSDAETTTASHRNIREYFVPFGEDFTIHPGRFVLGATLEWISLPSCYSAVISGRSSLGRHGLIIETASGIHPGFNGCLTLELTNLGEVPVLITPGMSICQVFFHKVTRADLAHGGSFSGSRKPSVKPPKFDPIVKALKD